MSEWENCTKRFPFRTSINEPECEHLSIAFDNYFVATEKGQHFIFANLGGTPLWSTGPTHPWHYLEDNEQIREEFLTAKFLQKEYINNLHPLKGTGQYQGKEVKYSIDRYCWVYLNNRTVHFHGSGASETPDSPVSPADDDTARVEEILERTETTVSLAIQKLQSIS